MHSWSLNQARRYPPKDDVLVADVPLEDHGFHHLCPHPATENDSISVVADFKALDPRIRDIKFPLRIYYDLPQTENRASRECTIWYCNHQSSLMLHAQHEGTQIWLRYSLASLVYARHLKYIFNKAGQHIPSQGLYIKFDQKPDVFIQSVEDPWVGGCPDSCSDLWIEFANNETLIFFTSWLSNVTSSIPRAEYRPLVEFRPLVRHEFHCVFCVFSFRSVLLYQLHQLFHDGAYVDVFGCRLDSASRATVDDLVVGLDVYDEVPLRLMVERVGFRCGSSLINGNSWGCRKIFAGLSAFAGHLKSSVGSICWTPLLTCAAIGLQPSPNLAQHSACSGLPTELFKLYPALKRIQWNVLVDATHFSERIPYSSPSVLEQSDALSTITSVSWRTESSSEARSLRAIRWLRNWAGTSDNLPKTGKN